MKGVRCVYFWGAGGGMHSKSARKAAASAPLRPRARPLLAGRPSPKPRSASKSPSAHALAWAALYISKPSKGVRRLTRPGGTSPDRLCLPAARALHSLSLSLSLYSLSLSLSLSRSLSLTPPPSAPSGLRFTSGPRTPRPPRWPPGPGSLSAERGRAA
jgi:hypothetical protein